MATASLAQLRQAIRERHFADERTCLDALTAAHAPTPLQRQQAAERAIGLVTGIRSDASPGLMEVFLGQYGLSTTEGVALMCLAEALLRVPDASTVDELIEDKIAGARWSEHLGKSSSTLVNASTWALMFTGKVLDEDANQGLLPTLRALARRLGEPVIRVAVRAAMRELGNQFVLGETIGAALERGRPAEAAGFTFSFDMLGEAALTAPDAAAYFKAYRDAIIRLGDHARSADIRDNPGISIKLSALHPRYELGQRDRVLTELVESTRQLAVLARQARIGLNIDAEEAARLDLSLDVIEAVLRDEQLAGWDGFGVVVQAYGKRAPLVIDWLHALAVDADRRIMIRLVKGAYWDSEVKRSQVENHPSFPVFTKKQWTDVSYICCAQKLLGLTDRIYPQFATHNAHTVATILEMATDRSAFEFQRLHGMGEVLHRLVHEEYGTRCRIYAPVGAHRDLLAYLVRRLLENGANSSFVNQLQDKSIPPAAVATDPFDSLAGRAPLAALRAPADLFQPERLNSRGWDMQNERDIAQFEQAREPFRSHRWAATPLLVADVAGGSPHEVINPANPHDVVGSVFEATPQHVESALAQAAIWSASPAERRSSLLRASDLFETHSGEFFALLTREAGKTPADAIAELREAVDFLRYYAARIDDLGDRKPAGLFACISPWNFPLAIFTGQIAAALAAGNAVLAKPADPTPLIAHLAITLLHQAGVPRDALQFLPGRGSVVGARLVADPRIGGVCFTGSTATAQSIHRSMAGHAPPDAPLIAETGGLNAMLVDSTALPEQAVRDILASAFRSAGQRCSALRILFVQEDIAPALLSMLAGAMDELVVGDPWAFNTDIGPVINRTAQTAITDYIAQAAASGRLVTQIAAPSSGTFVGPAVIRVASMADMQREIFGPVLHVATFKASQIDAVIADINASGYGLTFGLHSRIDSRIDDITSTITAGNIYVNRNQIGAIVGSQPFGGEGLSGTGPKAGGPRYVPRFTRADTVRATAPAPVQALAIENVQRALIAAPMAPRTVLERVELPGPTGESNVLSVYGRGRVLCLGPTPAMALEQARIATQSGCVPVIICPGVTMAGAIDGYLDREHLSVLAGFDAVAAWSDDRDLVRIRQALARREGAILPLLTGHDMAERCQIERHVCKDTTASGGNATLLATMGA